VKFRWLARRINNRLPASTVLKTVREPRKGANVHMSEETSENTIIKNQEKILANQEQVLANQLKLEEVLKNQSAIIGNQEKLDKILANQEEILENQKQILAK
jgi:hypothetical protein